MATANGLFSTPSENAASLREELAVKEEQVEELWGKYSDLEKDYLGLKRLYEIDLAARNALREARLAFRETRLKDRMDQLECDRTHKKHT